LITSFLKRLLEDAPPELTSVVLFGSMARGDYDKGSDIDLLLVFEEENPKRHMDWVAGIITELRPHREIRPTFTNLKDVDPSLVREVLREGRVLYGRVVMSPEGAGLRAYKIISYDLRGASSTVRARVARRIYGYESEKEIKGKVKKYTYEGLKSRKDCYVLGKGVVALPQEDAIGFIEFLKRSNVAYKEIDAWL
jgi:predicted nucleotidyltransferase